MKISKNSLEIIFNYLVRWLAPSLSFTMKKLESSNQTSIHLEDFTYSAKYENLEINENWKIINKLESYNKSLEIKRAEKLIGSSLEAHVDIYVESETLKN